MPIKNTVQDLIDILQTIEDKDSTIMLEGCDCIGLWNGKFDRNYVAKEDGMRSDIILNRK